MLAEAFTEVSAAYKRMDLATLTRMVVDTDADVEFQDFFGQPECYSFTAPKAAKTNV